MFKPIIPFIFLLFLSLNVFALNNIYEFDDIGNLFLTTSVYINGVPNNETSCNLTIFNPPPNENFINLSAIMNNKGNGIHSINLTGNLSFNTEIYPLTLYCNDSAGHYGYDERVGIKVGVNLYDFIIPGLILLSLSFLFIFISYKSEDKNIGKMFFYIGLVFVLLSLFYGLITVNNIPNSAGYMSLFISIISIFLIILVIVIWNDIVNLLRNVVTWLSGSK